MQLVPACLPGCVLAAPIFIKGQTLCLAPSQMQVWSFATCFRIWLADVPLPVAWTSAVSCMRCDLSMGTALVLASKTMWCFCLCCIG